MKTFALPLAFGLALLLGGCCSTPPPAVEEEPMDAMEMEEPVEEVMEEPAESTEMEEVEEVEMTEIEPVVEEEVVEEEMVEDGMLEVEELRPARETTTANWIDQLGLGESYSEVSAPSRDELRRALENGRLVLVENALWDTWSRWGFYEDFNDFVADYRDRVTVLTLAAPEAPKTLRERARFLKIRHAVVIDRGFREGYHFITPEGELVGAALSELRAEADRLLR